MLPVDTVTVGRSYAGEIAKSFQVQYAAGDGIGYAAVPVQRPVYVDPVLAHDLKIPVRRVRSPLDMSAAAGMYAQGLHGLTKPKRSLLARLRRGGATPQQARAAILQLIQAGHVADRTV